MPWDFALILLFFATVVPLLGRRRIRQIIAMSQTTRLDRLRLYASTIAFQWLSVAVILWRAAARHVYASDLGVACPYPERTVAVAVLLSGLVLANQLVSLRRLATHPTEAQGILPQLARKIFPQDQIERLAFVAVVVTVSICEELIFRGFAQLVFQNAFGGRAWAGFVGSALLFAIAHLYQGRRGLAATFVVGIAFSAIRYWTGSLLAPCVAHFTADLIAGFLAPARVRVADLA